MSAPLRWGAFVPQGWKLEFTGLGAADAWSRAVEVAKLAEGLGYDHLWVYDHVETVPRREATHCFEAYTMLAALSQQTSRAQLGQMVTCASYRNVGLLAKEVACLDVYSGGRAILGLGAGWYDREYQAYGYRFPPAKERLKVLDEALSVIPRLWSEETVDFTGEHLRFDGAYCDPKPLQSPRPPIWVGGGGEKVTLRIEARHADVVNWQCSLEAFRRKDALLHQYCEEIGRTDEPVRTFAPDCRLFETEADFERWLDSPDGGSLWGREDPREYAKEHYVGTVEQVVEKVQAFTDAGAREHVLWFRDYPSTYSLEAFVREVAPKIGS